MGIESDRFVDDVNEGLLCCICRDVLEDPLQAPCEHAFCRSCIQGWLVNERTCPEDRQTLFLSDLRPLFRYMRNDLDKLRLHCVNFQIGCQVICTVENVQSHENSCDFSCVTCPIETCELSMTRKELAEHLVLCHPIQSHTSESHLGSQECPKGCGLLMMTDEDREHNCLAELRTSIEVLRAEMLCQMEDQRREMEARLDLQRGHMVQREAVLQGQIAAVKVELSLVSSQLKLLLDIEEERRVELDKMAAERAQLLNVIKELQQQQQQQQSQSQRPGATCQCGSKGKVTTI